LPWVPTSALLALSGETMADTAETTATDPPGAGEYRRRRRRNVRLFAALGLAALAVAAVLAVYWQPSPEPARVLGVEVRQMRGPDESPVGVLGVDRKTIELNDAVRFSVKLSAPAYCYLVAFNPDGGEQLLHPEAATEEAARAAVPRQVAELQFPGEGLKFVLDQPGVQAFVLVASSRPLPSYAEWRSRAGRVPWQKADPLDPGGMWRFDGSDWAELVERWELQPWSKAAAKLKLPDVFKKSGGSGKTEKRGKEPPKARVELAGFFRRRPEFDAVHVLSFPVFKQW
jgi:hypothetical protein